jgi:hypothetical protein
VDDDHSSNQDIVLQLGHFNGAEPFFVSAEVVGPVGALFHKTIMVWQETKAAKMTQIPR